jgi:hypothetical protein
LVFAKDLKNTLCEINFGGLASPVPRRARLEARRLSVSLISRLEGNEREEEDDAEELAKEEVERFRKMSAAFQFAGLTVCSFYLYQKSRNGAF